MGKLQIPRLQGGMWTQSSQGACWGASSSKEQLSKDLNDEMCLKKPLGKVNSYEERTRVRHTRGNDLRVLMQVQQQTYGESYAGHFVPQFASLILSENKKRNQTIINLKGIAAAVYNADTGGECRSVSRTTKYLHSSRKNWLSVPIMSGMTSASYIAVPSSSTVVPLTPETTHPWPAANDSEVKPDPCVSPAADGRSEERRNIQQNISPSSVVMPLTLNKEKNPELKAFIEKCIGHKRVRPSACELLNDPFLEIGDDDKRAEVLIPIALLDNTIDVSRAISLWADLVHSGVVSLHVLIIHLCASELGHLCVEQLWVYRLSLSWQWYPYNAKVKYAAVLEERPRLPVDKIRLGREQVTKNKYQLVSHSWFTGGEHWGLKWVFGAEISVGIGAEMGLRWVHLGAEMGVN
ncbi:serine/threonine-protein kinase WNK11 [Artemisia annua]|uniref:Serine/threonine-protein kinase WNK11 n=1 Tax=Artemisia annua TaxID=35608 RepID=A0A2U1N2F3_ARTAN|nr:serine/threonine-protein kinase WNK11 [Artemisia annua]